LEDNLKHKGVKNIKFKNAYLEIEDKVDPAKIANTFGVYKVEVVEKFDFPQDFHTDELSDEDYASLIVEKIYLEIQERLKKLLKDRKITSFRVSVKRENKSFFLNSLQIQQILGKLIEEDFNLHANYKQFDLEIKIRILKDSFWLWTNFDEIK
jgi:adenylyl- and sulfurtransferase ThiI